MAFIGIDDGDDIAGDDADSNNVGIDEGNDFGRDKEDGD